MPIPAWRKTLRVETILWLGGVKSLPYKYVKL